jgi:parallel beta-helix repeat protein
MDIPSSNFSISLIFLLVVSSSCAPVGVNNSKDFSVNFGETIYVDDDNLDGPWYGTLEYPFRYIQDGIDASMDNDTVFVFQGKYYENILINKSINLIGEEETIVDGGYSSVIVDVTSENVKVKNFIIRNSSGYPNNAGVRLNSNNNVVENCIIYRTKTGVYLNDSSYNEIKNCTFHNNGDGIFIKSSSNVLINGCSLAHNSIGMYFENSSDNLVKHCYLRTNGIAFFISQSSELRITLCNISDNSVNIGGVFIVGCTDVMVSNCLIRHNGAGMSISSSRKISVTNCSFYWNTHYGLILRRKSYDVVVTQTEIRDNFRFGVYIERDNHVLINSCNIYNNTLFGIYSKTPNCDARHNWWGSPLGPFYNEEGKAFWSPGRVRFFPWLLKPVEENAWDEPYIYKEVGCITYREIELPGVDSDGDCVPDWWETKWGYNPFSWDDHLNLDPDEDALNNVEECFTDYLGSNPFHKDIFLELDWIESLDPDASNKPPVDVIEEAVMVFDEHDVTLHVDVGELGGGEEIPLACAPGFSFAMLRDLYWRYFLRNDLNNPRKGIFHYGLICNYCPDLNFPFFGWDQFDSFAISAQWMKEKCPAYSRGRLIVGGAVHHLGHSLGLLADTFGGIDNLGTVRPFTLEWWKYRNYKSCMNYWYKYSLFSYSDGTNGVGDFDDWNNLDFSFFKNSCFEWPKK